MNIHQTGLVRMVLFLFLLSAASVPFGHAQVTGEDVRVAAFASRTLQASYLPAGGDMKLIEPLIAEASKAEADPVAAYRARTHVLLLMSGAEWTPAGELITALVSGSRIPIMIVAGAKDVSFPVADCRAIAGKVKALGYPVKYAEYPEGDHMSVAILSISDIFQWFDAQPEKR